MSKLSEMIATLCPNGVEYKKLGEIFDLRNGYTPSKGNKDFWGEGNIPWFRMEDIRANGRILNDSIQHVSTMAVKGELFPANSIIVATSATIGEHALVTVPFLANQRFTSLTLKKEFSDRLLPMFIYYYCFRLDEWCLNNTNVSSFSSVDMVRFRQFKFPLPPLPVQREIVQILDNFANLTAELTAELAKRKKQYEHYRDMLLNFAGGGRNDKFGVESGEFRVEWKRLGEVAMVTKLAGFEFTNFVRYSDKGSVIALRGLNVKNGHLVLDDVKYVDGSDFSKLGRSKLFLDDMLFTYVGTVGQVALIDKDDKYYLAPNVALIRFDQKVVYPAFMKFYFQTNHFMKSQIDRLAGESSMKNLTMEKIRCFQIPLPPLAEQKRIVAILDRFDSLCNSLTDGLPAEIELRKKQYEYYRDKLLSFKEVG